MISFFAEEIDFQLSNEDQLKSWINDTIGEYEVSLSFINYIFCDDKYLHKINMEYLQHDTLTDIITFDYADTRIESDIFISIERVTENAKERKLPFETELHRVMIHGVLHLLGNGDKTEADKAAMRALEDECLARIA